MAIQFARCEYISRSSGGNACRKASYNQRDVLRCERTGELFSFKERDGNMHHEILLPEGADKRFKSSSLLWNEAENCEKRKDSQVAKEFVLALPDDAEVTLEDRIELTRRFSQIFVEKGVAVQLDVHSPHESEKNWHAHLLITTRRFSEDGLTFLSKKATDLDPIIRRKKVVEANLWGEVWRDLQNDYFQEKGYAIRVDPIGIVPQEHLGPVRMRHHLNEAVLRAQLLEKANEKIAQNPQAVLEEITHHRSVFTRTDVELFLRKHVPLTEREGLLERVVESPNVVPLYDKDTEQKTPYFTTTQVRAEEEKLLRFSDAIANRSARILPSRAIKKGLEKRTLNDEQKKAYEVCVNSCQNLTILQGRAGVGKSYALSAIREAHEASGFRTLGLAPTHKVAMDLKKDGFHDSKTCHSFLFRFKNGREKLNTQTLVIVDEAGMLGTSLSVELFNAVKKSGAKLILVGDDRQLSAVERGVTFRFLRERYGSVELKQVRRQSIAWQKSVSESLAEGEIKTAVGLLQEHKAISWNDTKERSLVALLKAYGKESLLNTQESRLILAQKNIDVDALNQGARDILKAQGRLGEREIICSTQRGRAAFAEGDRIQFTKTDKEQGLLQASFGIIEHIDLKTKKITVKLDNNEVKKINPDAYDGLRHGYASTVFKAQGATLDHVYVLHSPTTHQPTNYVALTRQAKSLHLYVSHEETPSEASLIHQMGRPDGKGTSLVFDTLQEIEKRKEEKTFTVQLKHGAEAILTKIKDIFHRHEKFYRFEKPTNIKQAKAEVVVKDGQDEITSHQVAGKKQPTQQVEQHSLSGPRVASSFSLDAKVVEEALKQNMASFADDIFSSIGESYNPEASSSTERRYGKKGHIAVNLKTGAWIDYKNNDRAGGPLHMLTKLKGLSFKEALEYGASRAGLSEIDMQQGKSLALTVQAPEREDKAPTEEEISRINRAQALWDKGLALQDTLAERYLREHRKIEGPLPDDLRYLPLVTDPHTKKSFPCLMAAAKSPEGNVTAVQLTFLEHNTAQKADIPVSKRSFGIVKGSNVTLQEDKDSNTLFVAEGVETALSLKSAGIQGTIKASLGLSNMKRIVPDHPNTHIIICADHDAPQSSAAQSLEKSILALQEQGLNVTCVKPEKLGEDFNDVLKNQGIQGVRDMLTRNLPKSLLKFMTSEKEDLIPATHDKPAFEKKEIENNERTTVPTFGEKHIHSEATSRQALSFKEIGEKVFAELSQDCLQKLYADRGERVVDFTPDYIKRLEIQSEKAANFIFHTHTLHGTRPTEKETEYFLLRAKYELDRIPEIRDEIITDWRKAGIYKREKDELEVHMMAERQAFIEGRLYLETKQWGRIPYSKIPELAKEEIQINNATALTLAEKLAAKQRLSKSAATFCAKDIVRYMETHGEKPSSEQISAMAQIAQNLDKLSCDPSIGFHNIEYLRRRDSDLQFREWSASNRELSGFKEFPHAVYIPPKSYTPSLDVEKSPQITKASEKDYGMDFLM